MAESTAKEDVSNGQVSGYYVIGSVDLYRAIYLVIASPRAF